MKAMLSMVRKPRRVYFAVAGLQLQALSKYGSFKFTWWKRLRSRMPPVLSRPAQTPVNRLAGDA